MGGICSGRGAISQSARPTVQLLSLVVSSMSGGASEKSSEKSSQGGEGRYLRHAAVPEPMSELALSTFGHFVSKGCTCFRVRSVSKLG